MTVPKNHKPFFRSINIANELDLNKLITEEAKELWLKAAIEDHNKHSKPEQQVAMEDIKDLKVKLYHDCLHERAWDTYDSCEYYCNFSFIVEGILPMTPQEIEAEEVRKAKAAIAKEKAKVRQAKVNEKLAKQRAAQDLKNLTMLIKKNPQLAREIIDGNS